MNKDFGERVLAVEPDHPGRFAIEAPKVIGLVDPSESLRCFLGWNNTHAGAANLKYEYAGISHHKE